MMVYPSGDKEKIEKAVQDVNTCVHRVKKRGGGKTQQGTGDNQTESQSDRQRETLAVARNLKPIAVAFSSTTRAYFRVTHQIRLPTAPPVPTTFKGPGATTNLTLLLWPRWSVHVHLQPQIRQTTVAFPTLQLSPCGRRSSATLRGRVTCVLNHLVSMGNPRAPQGVQNMGQVSEYCDKVAERLEGSANL